MSTIKVDTLQTRAGSTAAVTGAGFVATDQIKGNTTATTVTLPTTTNIGATAIVSGSAGSATIIGEGGTNTTNIQQGLAKAWSNLDGSSFGLNDSFNLGSATDDGSGDYGLNFTNNMANTNYSGGGLGGHDAGSYTRIQTVDHDHGLTTAQFQINTQDTNGTAADMEPTLTVVAGDLA